MKKKNEITRRNFLKTSVYIGAGSIFPLAGLLKTAQGQVLMTGLSDPALQPKFQELAPNALDPGFKLKRKWRTYSHDRYDVFVKQANHMTGLNDTNGNPVSTTIWGYGQRGKGVTWPGRTFEVKKNRQIRVKWKNKLKQGGNPLPHLLPVDDTFHWAYGLHGYQQFSTDTDGVPIVPHLHGGHTRSDSDGGPEQFFSPNWAIKGPRFKTKVYKYDNTQDAANLWYHDHCLGITRLNVYAGLAGFYIIRDHQDTGKYYNPLGLPAGKYELAYAIQDRMFRDTGELFFPAFPGEPAYADFITDEGAVLPPDIFPGGGPTGLAEFFGDHMVVNGKIWPKTDVEPRNYRMRLLNGTDSRFLGVRFRVAASPGSTDLAGASAPIPFTVIGSDQGLAAAAASLDQLLMGPGERFDVVVDFSSVPAGSRVIMENIGGDAPFGGDLVTDPGFDPADLFPDRQTDRIMAFDVNLPLSYIPDHFDPAAIAHFAGNSNPVDNVRKLALFEGKDNFGRLQPMLGSAEPVIDVDGNTVDGSLQWHQPTTENPASNSTEIWEIHNATGDAHPIHLHLVHFEILDKQDFTADPPIAVPTIQHDGTTGTGFRLENIVLTPGTLELPSPEEKAPKDMVTVLPGKMVRIKMTFDRNGRYVWHCHILSHEDHDMMRVLHVGPGASA